MISDCPGRSRPHRERVCGRERPGPSENQANRRARRLTSTLPTSGCQVQWKKSQTIIWNSISGKIRNLHFHFIRQGRLLSSLVKGQSRTPSGSHDRAGIVSGITHDADRRTTWHEWNEFELFRPEFAQTNNGNSTKGRYNWLRQLVSWVRKRSSKLHIALLTDKVCLRIKSSSRTSNMWRRPVHSNVVFVYFLGARLLLALLESLLRSIRIPFTNKCRCTCMKSWLKEESWRKL